MQYSKTAFLKKASWTSTIEYFIKGGIFVAITVFIFLKLQEHPVRISKLAETLALVTQTKSLGFLLLLPLLTFINWLLEACKWQLLAHKIEKVSLGTSLRGVLTGLSLGFITPHALGDYAGRIWQLKSRKRTESVGAILLGRAAQFFATFTLGAFGVVYFLFDSSHSYHFIWTGFLGAGLAFGVGLCLFVYFRKAFLKLLNIPILLKYKKYFEVIVLYSTKEVLKLLGLAFGRYFVFSTQFVLLLYLFRVSEDGLLLVSGVFWTLLAKSTIPAFNFLSDLGIREFSALYFFSHYQVDLALVVIASFALWCINILLPAMLGLIGIASMKIFRKA